MSQDKVTLLSSDWVSLSRVKNLLTSHWGSCSGQTFFFVSDQTDAPTQPEVKSHNIFLSVTGLIPALRESLSHAMLEKYWSFPFGNFINSWPLFSCLINNNYPAKS